MNRKLGRALLALALSLLLATPAVAQFEEPDTVPKFSVGIFANLNFRGSRGQTTSGVDVSLSNGFDAGARLDYRIARTVTFGLSASYAPTKEKLTDKRSDTVVIGLDGIVQLQFAGELLIRVKPQIPGYFIVGGGARVVNSSAVEGGQLTSLETFTDPFGEIGAGLEFASTSKRAFRFDMRLYLVMPSDQTSYEVKTISTEFSFGFTGLYRP